MKIIIERGLTSAARRLAETAERAGHLVVTWGDGDPIPTGDLFFGSLTVCPRMPGVIGDPEKLKVSHWLPLVEDIALNSEVVYATVGTLPYPEWPVVFVRPDSAMKPFAGRLLDRNDLSPAALDHGFYFDNLDLPVVLAKEQKVTEEWRFVSVAGQVVASSGYTANREALLSRVPKQARAFADEAARRSPEPSVVIDICQLVDGSFKLVEYNLLSGADLYGCNPKDIVAALGTIQLPVG